MLEEEEEEEGRLTVEEKIIQSCCKADDIKWQPHWYT
jgi:hypothetical protein